MRKILWMIVVVCAVAASVLAVWRVKLQSEYEKAEMELRTQTLGLVSTIRRDKHHPCSISMIEAGASIAHEDIRRAADSLESEAQKKPIEFGTFNLALDALRGVSKKYTSALEECVLAGGTFLEQ